MDIQFDKEKLEKAVVEHAANEILSEHEIYEGVQRRVRELVDARVAKELDATVQKAMDEAMRSALEETITPVNTWGEKVGEPTTLKAAIHDRAVKFWQEKVDKEGKRTDSYSGRPRHEFMMQQMMAAEFSSAIKQDIVNVCAALKDAVRDDYHKIINENLNQLFKVKSLGDQGKSKS